MNIWIPIKNCEKNNAMKYIKNSHLFKRAIDFNFKIRSTNVKKGSVENKIGLLYTRIEKLNLRTKYRFQDYLKKIILYYFMGT